jgi:hypothetical protein
MSAMITTISCEWPRSHSSFQIMPAPNTMKPMAVDCSKLWTLLQLTPVSTSAPTLDTFNIQWLQQVPMHKPTRAVYINVPRWSQILTVCLVEQCEMCTNFLNGFGQNIFDVRSHRKQNMSQACLELTYGPNDQACLELTYGPNDMPIAPSANMTDPNWTLDFVHSWCVGPDLRWYVQTMQLCPNCIDASTKYCLQGLVFAVFTSWYSRRCRISHKMSCCL